MAEVKALEERSGFADQIPDLFYRVQTGDSLGLIAQNHNTSIKTLVTLNNLRSRHRINAGQLLRIPKAGAATSADSLAVASTDAGHDRGRQSLSDEASPAQNQPTSEPVPASNSQAGPSVDSRNATQAPSVSAHAREAPAGKDESTPEENETVVIAQSDLAADPADYRVAADGTIEVQAGETLGHYAHWLKLPTQRLRELNDIGFNQHLIVGNRLRLAFSTVDAEVFERKRADHHARIQNLFFERHMITDVKTHALTNGDNLWELSMKTYQVPLWLLRQYNPDLTFDTVLSVSGSVRIPIVQISDGSARSQPEASSDALQEVAKLN
jgi:membrane-bound lytic murein transglycosylase D